MRRCSPRGLNDWPRVASRARGRGRNRSQVSCPTLVLLPQDCHLDQASPQQQRRRRPRRLREVPRGRLPDKPSHLGDAGIFLEHFKLLFLHLAALCQPQFTLFVHLLSVHYLISHPAKSGEREPRHLHVADSRSGLEEPAQIFFGRVQEGGSPAGMGVRAAGGPKRSWGNMSEHNPSTNRSRQG